MIVPCILALIDASAACAQISTEPVWSPDGSRIAFARGIWPRFAVYTINPDGSHLQRLTHSDTTDYYPAWSPDGRRLAFVSLRDGIHAIYMMALDTAGAATGADPVRLSQSDDSVPAWSPDGRKIVFVSKRDGNKELYVMKSDGSEQQRLTHNPGSDDDPQWSPDGTKIVFASQRDGHHDEIYVMDLGSAEIKRLTHIASSIEAGRREAKYARRPRWSPDGRKIAFGSNVDGNDEIYVMESDGTGVTRLTFTPAREYYSAWSPDGQKIVFSSNRDPEHGYQLFIMGAGGANPVRLTTKDQGHEP